MSDTIFQFFGLRENPFKINPDPRFLFATEQSRAAADELTYGISTRKGLLLLTGEVGTGKTMLIRRLLDWLAEQQMPTAFIFNSHIQSDHLIDFILNDFGVSCTSPMKSDKLLALNTWLLERYRQGQSPVLIVDEAQGLDTTTLEEIRLLLNLETPREKLLQIVLAGQPELEAKLKRHELRQLRQRVTIRCRTFPLTMEQTHGYLRERLNVAGANDNPIFEPEAVRSVHAYSHGIPRVINVLCEHALIDACADGTPTISASAVDRAARACQLDRADSVARILQTGSYSNAELSGISAIFASVSSVSESAIAAPAKTPPARVPAPPPSRFPHTPRAVAAAEFATPTIPLDYLAPSIPSTAATSLPLAIAVEAPIPPAQSVHVESQSGPLPRPLVSAPQHSPFDFLRHWGRSFAADARSSARQVHRSIHSFGVKTWKPFVRNVRHEFDKLPARTSRLLSDPRWKQLHSRVRSTSQSSWRALKGATLPRLTQLLNLCHRHVHKAAGAPPPRAARRRPIGSLRRWLHEPLTSQRKR
jgi:general secretion pathway protein A